MFSPIIPIWYCCVQISVEKPFILQKRSHSQTGPGNLNLLSELQQENGFHPYVNINIPDDDEYENDGVILPTIIGEQQSFKEVCI